MLELDDDLLRRLARVNELRAAADADDKGAGELAALEGELDARLGASTRLATYGSLAPGAPNHHHLDGLVGAWSEGFVRGELRASGWGSALGFPALRPEANGPDVVPARLFTSADLHAHWARLDAFEGAEYRRLLVAVLAGRESGGLLAVANLYAEATP